MSVEDHEFLIERGYVRNQDGTYWHPDVVDELTNRPRVWSQFGAFMYEAYDVWV